MRLLTSTSTSTRTRHGRGRSPAGLVAVLVALALLTVPGGGAGAATTAEAAEGPLPIGAEVAASTARPGSHQLSPAVARNGFVHLVVWSEVVEGVEARSIWATTVSASGTVLDPGGILLSGASLSENMDGGGTTALVAAQRGLRFVGGDVNRRGLAFSAARVSRALHAAAGVTALSF